MTAAEKMRMCLAEAGFVEGSEYISISDLPSGGWVLLHGGEDGCPPDLQVAIDKARDLIYGPIITSPWTGADFTCGPYP